MDLFEEEGKTVIKTDLTRRVTFAGVTKTLPVYKILISNLFYNEQNDRISTWISEYKNSCILKELFSCDLEKYNNLIEGFITESNPDAIKKTKNSIELTGQREAGVVLRDGRIIDGNRRFTCIRKLFKENPEFCYFEAAILDERYESSSKQIKLLELAIQHGEEAKVGYNAIDEMIGIYHNIVETNLITIAEYAKNANVEPSFVKQQLEDARLLNRFLNYIEIPGQYHVARELDLWGPIDEGNKLLKKYEGSEVFERIQKSFFINALMRPAKDQSKFIRNIKDVVGSSFADEYLDEQELLEKEVKSILPPNNIISAKTIKETVRGNKELQEKLWDSLEKYTDKIKRQETRDRPEKLIEKAMGVLDDIDTNIISKLSTKEFEELYNSFQRLEFKVTELRQAITTK